MTTILTQKALGRYLGNHGGRIIGIGHNGTKLRSNHDMDSMALVV